MRKVGDKVARKKIPKASKRRLMIFGTLSCVVMAYALLNLITYSYRMKQLSDQQSSLTAELKALKETEGNLKNEIQKLKDPDYLARYARENYLYTKNGEYVIKVDEDKKETKAEKEKNIFGEYKYIIIIGSIILLLMIFYILHTLKKDHKKVQRKK